MSQAIERDPIYRGRRFQTEKPWDYRYRGGATERELGETIAREALQPINERFYRDLGAQFDAWNVIYDLDPRLGKAPLAYTDYVKRGRMRHGKWDPTLTPVSGNYERILDLETAIAATRFRSKAGSFVRFVREASVSALDLTRFGGRPNPSARAPAATERHAQNFEYRFREFVV